MSITDISLEESEQNFHHFVQRQVHKRKTAFFCMIERFLQSIQKEANIPYCDSTVSAVTPEHTSKNALKILPVMHSTYILAGLRDW